MLDDLSESGLADLGASMALQARHFDHGQTTSAQGGGGGGHGLPGLQQGEGAARARAFELRSAWAKANPSLPTRTEVAQRSRWHQYQNKNVLPLIPSSL